METTSISYAHMDVLGDFDTEELYAYCERVYQRADFDSVDDMLENLTCLEFFPNGEFHDLLFKYLSGKNMDIHDVVRGYYPYKKGFLMFHGSGYDWKSADLLGGSYNGKAWRDFEDWCDKLQIILVHSS